MTAEIAKILEETKVHLDEHQKNSDKVLDLIQEMNLRKKEQEQIHEQMKMLVENDEDKEAEDVIICFKIGNVGLNNARDQEGKGKIAKGGSWKVSWSQGARTESQARATKRLNRRHASRFVIINAFHTYFLLKNSIKSTYKDKD
jgi:hypothetical protein